MYCVACDKGEWENGQGPRIYYRGKYIGPFCHEHYQHYWFFLIGQYLATSPIPEGFGEDERNAEENSEE